MDFSSIIIISILVFFKQVSLKGEKCPLPDRPNYYGKCVHTSRCFDRDDWNGVSNCGPDPKKHKVCCEYYLNDTMRFNSSIHPFCDVYNEKYYPAVYYSTVAGGRDAREKEYPHMAALGYGDKNIEWKCGGSLISERYVLTAAHCLRYANYTVRWVRMGNIKLYGDYSVRQDFEVVKKIRHPNYKLPLKYNDIALLKLNKKARIDSFVRPACLYTDHTVPGSDLIATGWGLLDLGGVQADTLQTVTLDFFTNEECNHHYKSVRRNMLSNGISRDTHICAGGKTMEKDTCPGDSGGPLQIYLENDKNVDIYAIVGITSFGKSCGITNVPGVYTKVSYYVPWIESIIWTKEDLDNLRK